MEHESSNEDRLSRGRALVALPDRALTGPKLQNDDSRQGTCGCWRVLVIHDRRFYGAMCGRLKIHRQLPAPAAS